MVAQSRSWERTVCQGGSRKPPAATCIRIGGRERLLLLRIDFVFRGAGANTGTGLIGSLSALESA